LSSLGSSRVPAAAASRRHRLFSRRGASAATGTTAPVREFFGIHDGDPTATPTIASDDDGTTATPDADARRPHAW
jgi:hypothetical protein